MLKDITLGQYFPGDTLIHRLDPRTKILMLIVYLLAIFTSANMLAMAVVAAFLGLIVAISRVKLRLLLRGLRPLLIILTITGLFNIFSGSGEPLLTIWRLNVTAEGLQRAFLLISRIALMVMGSFILTYTTPPMSLTDGLESLMGPLKRVRVPVHELTMIMSMALRFIPTLIEETDKIMSAQKARGANFETGNIFQRAKALLPLLIPLFMSAFRRADELAIAMESRCYHGGEGRTRMRQLTFGLRDLLAALVGAGLLAAVVTLRRMLG